MAHELDRLFQKIRNGAALLSAEDLNLVVTVLTKEKTEKLRYEALEEFSDRSKEDEELEAFSARTFRNKVLEELRFSRYQSVQPEVDALLKSHDLDVSTAIYNQLCRAALQGLANFYRNAEIIVTGGINDPRVLFEPDLQTPNAGGQRDEIEDGKLCLRPLIHKFISDKRSIFDVTLLTEPYRGSERVIWGGLVITGAYARAGGDYPALTLRSIVGIRRLHWLLFFDQTPLLKYQPIAV